MTFSRGENGLSISTEELKEKEVINILSGEKLGYADDFEIDTETGKVIALVILGRNRFFGLFGREDNIVIPFSEIQLIGNDTILVSPKSNLKSAKYIKI